jgi:3-keto-disaccharide hydrolase
MIARRRHSGAKSAWLLMATLALVLNVSTTGSSAGSPESTPLPIVAIHASELTQALESMPAVAPTPTGDGNSGKQWWYTSWHYGTIYESVEEALRSDGTPFVEVSDAQIAAGELRHPDGSPKYPILISLASEAIADNEIQPLREYVNSGGFMFVGSSSFTRNPGGTTRGDFAIADVMGLHMTNGTLQNWAMNGSFTKLDGNRLVSHIPSGTVAWRMPATSEQVPWGAAGCCPHINHVVWQVRAAAGTEVVATGAGGPLIATKAYAAGRVIYDGALQPLIGHGVYDPGMYAYLIFRNAIEWSFETANLPVVKKSPWGYDYDAAFVARHDYESDPSLMSKVESSARAEKQLGIRGDYFFSTGAIRIGSGDARYSDAQKREVLESLRRAVAEDGATIGSHNGGLKIPVGSFTYNDYNYWHWGPDEVLDATSLPPGYADGRAYAKESVKQSFEDIEGWLGGLDNGRAGCGAAGNCARIWVAPFSSSTREASYQILDELGVSTTGEQKISPFPHYTLSTQVVGRRYPQVTLPTSDWFVGGDIAESMETGHNENTIRAAIDFYYGLGALINIYSHGSSADGLPHTYISYAATKPRLWKTNAVAIYDWWQHRAPVTVVPGFGASGVTSTASATISGATDPDTAIEVVVPGTASGLTPSDLKVRLDGQLAPASSIRTTNNGAIKIKVGTSVRRVDISYTTPAKLKQWSQTDWSGGHGQGKWADAIKYDSATGVDAQTAGQLVLSTVSGGDSLFADDFTRQAAPAPRKKPFTADEGGAWTLPAGTVAAPNRASFDTSGGVLATATTSPDSYGYAYANRANLTDGSVEADIKVGNGMFGGGIAGRVNPATGARYAAWLYGNGDLKLIRFSDWGTWNTPGYRTASVGAPGSATHHLKLSFAGTLLKVFYDGAERISFDVASDTDADYASGQAGLDFFATPGTSGPLYSGYVVKDAASNVVFSDDFGAAADGSDQLAPWKNVYGSWTIGGGLISTTSRQNEYAFAYRDAAWSDYTFEGRFQLKADAFAAGIGGRVNPANGAHYGAWVHSDGSSRGLNVLKLVKFSSWTTWSGTPIAQANLPHVGTGWHTLKLAFDGNRIRASYDGSQLIDFTDNNADGTPAYTRGGISLDTWSATQPVIWDDVVVRTPSAYASQGQLVSSAFDGGIDVDWRSIAWDASMGPATRVCVRTRTADTPARLDSTAWSDCATQNGVVANADKRWIQYRVDLSSSSTSSTPVFHELRVAYIGKQRRLRRRTLSRGPGQATEPGNSSRHGTIGLFGQTVTRRVKSRRYVRRS